MVYPPPPPRRGAILSRIVAGLITTILFVSLSLNLFFILRFAAATAGPHEAPYQKGERQARIVILPVRGMIDDRMAVFVRESLATLRDNPPKAVILRVDSGGGTVAASDRIAHELVEFRSQAGVPIVASFGSLAASGGYYISANADHIIAEPTTITGSIGVIAEAFTVPGLLEKIGVTPEVVTSTPATKKDMLNPFRPWTDADRGMLRSILNQAHARFVSTVLQGRKSKQLTEERLTELATGEVFTAEEAIRNHLVDEQGYMTEAIAKAKELAQIDPKVTPAVTTMQPARVFSLLGAMDAGAPPSLEHLDAETARRWAGELAMPRLEYRMTP